jgi:hypothetical protein
MQCSAGRCLELTDAYVRFPFRQCCRSCNPTLCSRPRKLLSAQTRLERSPGMDAARLPMAPWHHGAACCHADCFGCAVRGALTTRPALAYASVSIHALQTLLTMFPGMYSEHSCMLRRHCIACAPRCVPALTNHRPTLKCFAAAACRWPARMRCSSVRNSLYAMMHTRNSPSHLVATSTPVEQDSGMRLRLAAHNEIQALHDCFRLVDRHQHVCTVSILWPIPSGHQLTSTCTRCMHTICVRLWRRDHELEQISGACSQQVGTAQHQHHIMQLAALQALVLLAWFRASTGPCR